MPDFLDFKSTFVYAWFDKWLQTRQAERCGLFGPLDPSLHLCNRKWYAVTHDAHSARICDNNDVHSEFVTTMTSTVRYSRSHLLSVDRYATSDTRSHLTGCVNLLLHQLCIFKRFSTRRKHSGGRKIAKQIETIVHCARVPTLTQRSRNVHNLIALPLCKQVSKSHVRVCYINAQSCRNKTLAIADHILDNQLDMMAISATWLKSSRDSNVIKDIVPNGYCIKHTTDTISPVTKIVVSPKQQQISTVIGHGPITRRATSNTHTSSQTNENLITVKLTSDSMNCAKLVLLNARSVRNKTDFITDYIHEHDLDIIALTETWLTNDQKDTANIRKLTPDGYNFVHFPRSDQQGGGVGVLYKSCLTLILS